MPLPKAESLFCQVSSTDDADLIRMVAAWNPWYRHRKDEQGNQLISEFRKRGINPCLAATVSHNRVVSLAIDAGQARRLPVLGTEDRRGKDRQIVRLKGDRQKWRPAPLGGWTETGIWRPSATLDPRAWPRFRPASRRAPSPLAPYGPLRLAAWHGLMNA